MKLIRLTLATPQNGVIFVNTVYVATLTAVEVNGDDGTRIMLSCRNQKIDVVEHIGQVRGMIRDERQLDA